MISLSSRWMNLEKSCVLNIVSCEHCDWLLASTIVLICRHKMTCFMDFSVPKFLGVQNPGRGEGQQLGGWRWPWDCDHTTKLSRLLRRIIISIWRVFTKILPNNIIKETTKSLVERLQFRRLASSWAEMREAWITKIITSTHERWHLRRLEYGAPQITLKVCCKSATSARGGLTASLQSSAGWACPNNSAQIGHKNWLAEILLIGKSRGGVASVASIENIARDWSAHKHNTSSSIFNLYHLHYTQNGWIHT